MAKVTMDRMTPSELADILSKSGSQRATEETVKGMISEGAPVNEDGTISLVKFTAWLEGRLNGNI